MADPPQTGTAQPRQGPNSSEPNGQPQVKAEAPRAEEGQQQQQDVPTPTPAAGQPALAAGLPLLAEGERPLAGRVALVTGATSGLGLEAAAELARLGAKVIFGVRNPTKAHKVAEAIRERVPYADLLYPPSVPPMDTSDMASLHDFAAALNSDTRTPLHVLLNNAGTSMVPQGRNEEGINNLVQVNYLGAYTLTRLLEAKLVASSARVVCVSSVTHRCFELPRGEDGPQAFMHSGSSLMYGHSKLANDLRPDVLSPSDDLRFYARGAFASPLLTHVDGAWRHWLGVVRPSLYGASVVLHSLADYPVRHWSGGRMFNTPMLVLSAPQTYDARLAAALWDYSAQVAGLQPAPPPSLEEAAAHAAAAAVPSADEGEAAALAAADDAVEIALAQVEAASAATEVADAQDTAGPSVPSSWANLPHELLAAIIHPQSASKEVRLVCKSWHDAYDASVRRATLRLSLLMAVGPDLPRAPPRAPLVRLDAAHMALGFPHATEQDLLYLNRLAGMLQRWPLTAPLELNLSNNRISTWDVHALPGALRCPTFASGGLRVLDFTDNWSILSSMPADAQELVAALQAAQQLSALQELRLAFCGMDADSAAWLCRVLQAATHVRSLTLLDLSDNIQCGLEGLPACLRGSPHLSSLQRLLLRNSGIMDGAACALADAVAEARLPLVALDLSSNSIGDQSAAAWAAALTAATCLAGLEVLDLDMMWHVGPTGIAQLADALQAATHLTRLRRLSLLPSLTPPECADCIARLLQAAPHLAASLQELNFSGCVLSGAAMAVVLAGGVHLPRLTCLNLSGYCIDSTSEAVRQLCTALVAGTQLTGLRQLDLTSNLIDAEAFVPVAAALAAATHLSGLRALQLGDAGLYTHLLQAAPHLRGLTTLTLPYLGAPDWPQALRSLELLPALRSLTVGDGKVHGDDATTAPGCLPGLAAALQDAPCTPTLENLDIWWRHLGAGLGDAAAAAMHVQVAAALQACTRLTGLRRLTLRWWQGGADPVPGLVQACRMLGACRHLSGLQELRLCELTENFCERNAEQRRLVVTELARGGELAGFRVVFL